MTDDRLKMYLGEGWAWAESLAAEVPIVLLGLCVCKRRCTLVAVEEVLCSCEEWCEGVLLISMFEAREHYK